MIKVLLLCFPLLLFAWEEFKNLDEIKIYKKYEEKFKFVQFKAETTMPFSISTVSSTIMDHTTYTSWLSDCIKTDRKKDQIYFLLQPPWPLSKRQVWAEIKKHEYPKRQLITLHSLDTKVSSENAIWFNYLYAEFALDDLGKNKTRLTLSLVGDPRGSIPLWIVNFVAWEIPYKSLLSLKSYLQEH